MKLDSISSLLFMKCRMLFSVLPLYGITSLWGGYVIHLSIFSMSYMTNKKNILILILILIFLFHF